MKMKGALFNGIVAVLIAAAGFSMANAQGRGQRGPGPGGGPGGPGFGGRGPGGFERLADLTDEQRKQVQAILQEDRASREGPPAAVILHRQLEAEILADAPDNQKIDTLRQQLIQAQGEELAHRIQLQRKIAQVLTSEQRAKARERLAEGPRGRGERGEGRRPRPQAF
jgi:Spy/CpxP family protein refolding chaperone